MYGTAVGCLSDAMPSVLVWYNLRRVAENLAPPRCGAFAQGMSMTRVACRRLRPFRAAQKRLIRRHVVFVLSEHVSAQDTSMTRQPAKPGMCAGGKAAPDRSYHGGGLLLGGGTSEDGDEGGRDEGGGGGGGGRAAEPWAAFGVPGAGGT